MKAKNQTEKNKYHIVFRDSGKMRAESVVGLKNVVLYLNKIRKRRKKLIAIAMS